MNIQHTPGPWQYDMDDFEITTVFDQKTVALLWFADGSKETKLANAQLITEAGTVATETGKTPRQLADENRELLEVLQELMKVYNEKGQLLAFDVSIAKKAIQKATQP